MVTVVTVQGIEEPGVTIETDAPWFAVQIRLPSNVIPSAPSPRFDATTVAAPAAALGSIRER
jgi:hypothetical protein